MNPNIKTIPLTFEGGLATIPERGAAPANTVRELTNWEPGLHGGLVARSPFLGYTETTPPNVFQCLGLHFEPPNTLYAAVSNSNTASSGIKIYKTDDLSPGATAITWDEMDTKASATSIAYPVTFAHGTNSSASRSLYYTNPITSTGVTKLTTGGAVTDLTDSPTGYALEWHKSRMFCGGYTAIPGRLYYTEVNTPDTWDVSTTTNYIDIPDGYGPVVVKIMALKSYGEQLLIGTNVGIYSLTGSGPSSFVVTKLSGGGDCIPGNTIVLTPYGVVFVGHDNVWIQEGGPIHELDENVDVAISPNTATTSLKLSSAAYAKGKVFIADPAASKLWIYDFRSGAWYNEKVASDGLGTPRVLVAPYGDPQGRMFAGAGSYSVVTGGTTISTATSFLAYRDVESPRTIDTIASSEVYTMTSQAVSPGGPTRKCSFKRVHLRLVKRGTYDDRTLTLTPYIDGVAQTAKTLPSEADGDDNETDVIRCRVDLGNKDGWDFYFTLACTSTGSPRYDIQACELEYEVLGDR